MEVEKAPPVSRNQLSATAEILSSCEYARERHRNILMWRNLWTILLFAFGTAVVVFLVLAIALFIREQWLLGAITVLGTIVQGAAIKWVVDRRGEAVKEEEVAYQDVAAKCQDTRSADQLRENRTLFAGIR